MSETKAKKSTAKKPPAKPERPKVESSFDVTVEDGPGSEVVATFEEVQAIIDRSAAEGLVVRVKSTHTPA